MFKIMSCGEFVYPHPPHTGQVPAPWAQEGMATYRRGYQEDPACKVCVIRLCTSCSLPLRADLMLHFSGSRFGLNLVKLSKHFQSQDPPRMPTKGSTESSLHKMYTACTPRRGRAAPGLCSCLLLLMAGELSAPQ